MQNAYIGFQLCNLLIPGDPGTLNLATPSGAWSFDQTPQFAMNKNAITSNGQCGETYFAESTIKIGASRAASLDAAFDELLPICLGASYLTGLAVSPVRSTPASEISFITIGTIFHGSGPWGQARSQLRTFRSFAHSWVLLYTTSLRQNALRKQDCSCITG